MTLTRAIVFDLDDTLFPEREFAWSGFRAVAHTFANELGDPQETVNDLRRFFDSIMRPRVFDALLSERFGVVDPRMLAKMIETYRRHAPVITPYADVDAALTRLRERCKLGLITDGRACTQWAKIDALRLRPRFEHIIVTSDLQPDPARGDKPKDGGANWDTFAKPHPRAFEEMSRALQIPHRACAYVADNPGKDFVAPNRLGWKTIRIERPGGVYGTASMADGGQPQHSIKSLEELDGIIE